MTVATGCEPKFFGTDRFEVVKQLGAGSMGVVYQVHDRERAQPVALKTLHRADASALYRLKREFRALADINHPNVASLYELVSSDGDWFFTHAGHPGVRSVAELAADIEADVRAKGFVARELIGPKSVLQATLWWETTDPMHHRTSINGHQATFDADGGFRAVVAHEDPGVPNWLDPAGWEVGIVLLRWYRATEEQRVQTRKVPLAELRRHLPLDTPHVTRDQRRAEIEARRRALRRWYGYEPRE